MNDPRKRAWAIAVVAFLFGVAAGAAAMRAYFTHTLWTWSPSERFVRKLDQTLDLTPDQRKQVAQVLEEQKTRMAELKSVWNVDVRLVARDGEDRLGAILSPPQMDKFMRAHDDIHGWMTRYLWTSDPASTALAVTPKPASKEHHP